MQQITKLTGTRGCRTFVLIFLISPQKKRIVPRTLSQLAFQASLTCLLERILSLQKTLVRASLSGIIAIYLMGITEPSLTMPGYARTAHEPEPHFFRRDDLLLQLDQALLPSMQPKHKTSLRSCTLHGMGGVGKTQLALQFAFSREWHYHAIFWIQADETAKLAESFDRIARSLRVQDTSVTDDQVINRNLVLEWLSDPIKCAITNGTEPASAFTKWLVVFDNVMDEDLVRDYWPSGGNGSILVTSRQPMARPTFSVAVDMPVLILGTSANFLQTLVLNAAGPTLKLSHKLCEGSSWKLDYVRRVRNDLETKALVRALNMVACAFRPLGVDELIEALTTRFPTMIDRQDWEEDASWFGTSEDLKTLCIGFLEVRDSGTVEFSHGNMRSSILSHSFAPMNLRCGGDGHEMLAMVCIRHLRCLDSSVMLRPWTPAKCWLAEVQSDCALHSYTITFWQEHSRIADVYSREVPAMLHRTFMSILMRKSKQIWGSGYAQSTASKFSAEHI
jgi:hypothetical protein